MSDDDETTFKFKCPRCGLNYSGIKYALLCRCSPDNLSGEDGRVNRFIQRTWTSAVLVNFHVVNIVAWLLNLVELHQAVEEAHERGHNTGFNSGYDIAWIEAGS